MQHDIYIDKCVEKYRDKVNNFELSVGKRSLLKGVGRELAKMSLDDFKNVCAPYQVHAKPKPIARYSSNLLSEFNKHCYKTNQADYSDILKKVSLRTLILGGRINAEFWSRNLPVPSPSTSDHHLAQFGHVKEGEILANELAEHLRRSKVPKEDWIVFICEDDTSVIKRIEYDVKSDAVIGFTPHLSEESGLPFIRQFPASSPKAVDHYASSLPKSSMIHAIVAVPLSTKAGPFTLCCFGTDSKFTAKHVMAR